MLQVREVVKPAIPFAIQSAASLSAFTLGLALTQARQCYAPLFYRARRTAYRVHRHSCCFRGSLLPPCQHALWAWRSTEAQVHRRCALFSL